jgi:hypothetical protein
MSPVKLTFWKLSTDKCFKSMQLKRSFLIFTFTLLFFNKTQAQVDSSNTVPRIAILAPLYLDSAFNNYEYKLGNLNIPQYYLPGLEFYNGAMMCVDSLQKEGVDLDVWIFDTRKKNQSTDSLAKRIASLNFSLIIASFTGSAEQKIFSAVALNKNIPLVSATYPNDAFVNGNPFFILVNSTLKTHIEGIYKFVQHSYPVGKILFLTRTGTLENKIQSMFSDMTKKTYPIPYKKVTLPDSFTSEQLLPLLDSNKQNVIICGTVNEAFGTRLIKTLNEAPPSYTLVAVGMPTWDGLKPVYSTTNENLDIVYSTPFNYPQTDSSVAALTSKYKTKFNGRPSDMFFKGFESMYCFSKLLLKYHNDLLNNLSDTSFHLSNAYQFQPVKISSNTGIIADYFENKKLYYIDVSQGNIKSVN